MKEKRLDLEMSNDDFKIFIEVVRSGQEVKIISFIHQYIENNKNHNLSYNDVLSLGIINSLILKNHEVFKEILSLPHEGHILTTEDVSGYSPISFVLSLRNIPEFMDPIENYLKEKKDIQKIDLDGEAFTTIYSAMYGMSLNEFYTQFDTAEICRERFLQYIYTKESLDKLELKLTTDLEDNFEEPESAGEEQLEEMVNSVRTSSEDRSSDDSIEKTSKDSNQQQKLADNYENNIQTSTTTSQRSIGPATSNYLKSQEGEKKKTIEVQVYDTEQESSESIFDIVNDVSWIYDLPQHIQVLFARFLKASQEQKDLMKAIYDKLSISKLSFTEKVDDLEKSLSEANFENPSAKLAIVSDITKEKHIDMSMIYKDLPISGMILPMVSGGDLFAVDFPHFHFLA